MSDAHGYGIPVWQAPESAGHRAPASGIRRCHTAIVGAGLTGLSIALRLAEQDREHDVVVLEADRVAGGASGRGTGLVGPRVGPPLPSARKRYGDDTARALYRWSERAVDHVLAVCARHRIDCGLTPGSQLMVARDRHSMVTVARELEAAAALGIDLTAVAADSVPDQAGRCLGGLRYAPTATLDPAAFTRQLATTAERLGATIYEKCAVRRVDRGTRLVTDTGEIVADRVVLAVNGTSAGAAFRTGVIGMRVQAAATVPLTPRQLADLDWLRHQPLIEMGELAPYYRLTTDDRLIIGGGCVRRGAADSAPLDPTYLQAAAGLLHPSLKDIPLAYAWSGPIGMTLDALPVIGVQRNGTLVAGGWRGHGVAASTYAGTLLADYLLDSEKVGSTIDHAFPIPRGRARTLPSVRPVLGLLDAYLSRLERGAARSLGRRRSGDSSTPKTAVPAASTQGDENP
ncbi:FAD-binding oxidoreductase [Nocardia sp. NPDC046473]|uniref:NAD(P)/FAD-dependent oxidoreductase n=1 Tax=Nocardia sp. NPDC046473 TaxID=3155733 RepID=UPI0033D7A14C